MMRFRWDRWVVLTLAVLLAGCGGEVVDDLTLREDPFTVRPFEARGHAVCYGPHRDGQWPGGPEPSAAQLREDLALMLPYWDMVRVYGAGGVAETLLTVISEDQLDMKVVLGAWIAPDDDEANLKEITTAVRLARAHPDIVVAVSVGNETQIEWSAHRSSEQALVDYVRRMRACVDVPVTVADDFNFWNKPTSRLVAGEIDFIMMHAHPMWNGLQLEDALAWLQEQVADVQSKHPDRLVVLGETGWATMVHDRGEQAELIKGRPGETEQKIFFEATRAWADSTGLTLFFFEVFDENWKGGKHPDEVEKHWGLFRAGRGPKASMVNPSETP